MSNNYLPRQDGLTEVNYLSTFDFLQPQNALELIQKFNEGIMAVDILKAMDRFLPVSQDEWSVFEEGMFHRTVTLAEASSYGTDDGSLKCWKFVLDADDLDSNDNYYPRVGFHLLVPEGSNVYNARINKITESGSTITLYAYPLNSTIAVDVSTPHQIASGVEMSIITHSKGAGTGQPKAVSQGYEKRTFCAQILAESTKAEGTQLVNEAWFKKYENGGKILNLYSPELARAERRLDIYQEGLIMFGEVAPAALIVTTTNTNGTTDSEGVGNHIKNSQGLYSWNSSLGGSGTYADENFILDDLDQAEDHFRSQGINSTTILWMGGHKFKRQIDNLGLDVVTAASAGDKLIYDYLGQKGTKELGLQLGFSCIERSGFKHVFQNVDSFSNPQTYGAAGYSINKWGFGFPVSTVQAKDVNGKKISLPNISMRYRAMNGYSRKRELWTVGAAGNHMPYTGEHDVTRTYWRDHVGLQALKMNQSYIIKNA